MYLWLLHNFRNDFGIGIEFKFLSNLGHWLGLVWLAKHGRNWAYGLPELPLDFLLLAPHLESDPHDKASKPNQWGRENRWYHSAPSSHQQLHELLPAGILTQSVFPNDWLFDLIVATIFANGLVIEINWPFNNCVPGLATSVPARQHGQTGSELGMWLGWFGDIL